MWTPITQAELENKIAQEKLFLESDILQFLEIISISPEKWAEEEHGEMGGGFWVVAIFGKSIIWYNDIEEGFNVSQFDTFGKIGEYAAEQDMLGWTINKILKT